MDQAERLRSIVKQNSLNSEEQATVKAVIEDLLNEGMETGASQPEESVAEEPEKKARVITVTSGKGGVGKSSVSINLAIQLQRRGKEVIIFDADFGLANIEVMFGAVPKYNLSDVIYRGKAIQDVIVKGPCDIGFISGGSGISGLGNMNREQVMYLVEKLKELESMADVLIIDTGAGISDSVIEFVLSSEEVLLVTTPEPTSITDSYALLKTLNARAGDELEGMRVKLIANRVSDAEEAKNLYNKLNVVVNRFLKIKLDFLGMVPWDTNMPKAIMQQRPISIAFPTSDGARAIGRIADALLGQQSEAEANGEQKKGIAAAIVKMFRNRRS